MVVEGYVGLPGPVGDGTDAFIRLDKTRSQVVTDAHGRYREAVSRGKVFSGSTALAGTTIVAANNSPVGAAAASILSLYNPLGSGINASVLKAFLVGISGTPGAGAFAYNVALIQNITAAQNNFGSAGTDPESNLPSGSTSACKIFTQTALTGSGAQVPLRILGSATFAGAITAATPGLGILDVVDGEIELPPGAVLTIASAATGTAHIVAASFVWEEIAI